MQFCIEVGARLGFFFLKCFVTRNLEAAAFYYNVLQMHEANLKE